MNEKRLTLLQNLDHLKFIREMRPKGWSIRRPMGPGSLFGCMILGATDDGANYVRVFYLALVGGPGHDGIDAPDSFVDPHKSQLIRADSIGINRGVEYVPAVEAAPEEQKTGLALIVDRFHQLASYFSR